MANLKVGNFYKLENYESDERLSSVNLREMIEIVSFNCEFMLLSMIGWYVLYEIDEYHSIADLSKL